ncbi:D-sedoheptulose-7-phosphate isomerase [Rheinheimera sp.]|uniref:D-sedoheptulose-7-phosphate isomerase n=1 Tax=Rheinheimera sp. TaxID=1869214 RepID=UPI004047FCBC
MSNLGLASQLEEQISLLRKVQSDSNFQHKLDIAIEWLYCSLQDSLPVLVCGNGGSAADALHISGELICNFLRERKALNVICLNSNISAITACANDMDYDSIFERQVQAHGQAGGVCWVISTSGNSINVVKAMQAAKNLKMKTIALTGQGGGKLALFADLLIDVPSKATPRIQEIHLPIYHYICQQVEARIAYSDETYQKKLSQ